MRHSLTPAPLLFLLSLTVALALPACVAGEDDPLAQQTADIAAYEDLTAELDQGKIEVLGPYADYVTSFGEGVYWQDHSTATPKLRRELDGNRTSYTFSIGAGLELNYRASKTTVGLGIVVG